MSEPLPPANRRPSPLTVFRHRNYRLFFGGQLLSLLGTWIQFTGQAWLVYRLTGSPLALGMVGFAQQAPVFFFSAFGGTLADRFDRRTLLIAAQSLCAVQATTLAVLTFTNLITFEMVVGLALLFGLVNSVEIPTRQAFTVELVGKSDLQNAIALNSMMFNLARVGGPTIAGILAAVVGEAWCFAINAGSYVAVIGGLALMTLPRMLRPEPKHPWHELREGFSYVISHREIRIVLLALALSSFAGAPYMTLMPAMAEEVLHTDSRGYGFLMSAVGLGALGGAFAMSRMQLSTLARAPAIAAISFGISVIAFSISRDFWLSWALVLPTAFSLMLQGGATNTIVQTLVEDRMRGRVMAYFTMSFLGMIPFGSIAAGFLAHYVGVPMTLAIGGVIAAIAGVLALRVKLTLEPRTVASAGE
jgi:MFS family permease